MANTTYVTKGYSTYTNIPAQRGGYGYGSGYDHDTKHLGNQYVVETRNVERVRAPAAGYTDYVGSPAKAELLKEYVHVPTTMSGGHKYAPKNHYDDYEPNYGHNYDNTLRVHCRPGYVRTGNVSGPNKAWQAAGPPATHHPLTTSTNNVNEALGLLEVYYSPRADPRRRGVLDDLSTRAQPLEPQRRYARPAFVAKPNDARNHFTNTGGAIDSHEATRRYHGSFVP